MVITCHLIFKNPASENPNRKSTNFKLRHSNSNNVMSNLLSTSQRWSDKPENGRGTDNIIILRTPNALQAFNLLRKTTPTSFVIIFFFIYSSQCRKTFFLFFLRGTFERPIIIYLLTRCLSPAHVVTESRHLLQIKSLPYNDNTRTTATISVRKTFPAKERIHGVSGFIKKISSNPNSTAIIIIIITT